MKNIILSLSVVALLTACNENPGESGTVDDGIRAIDSNGALKDSAGFQPNPSIDTAMGDHRTDTWKRDTTTYRPGGNEQ